MESKIYARKTYGDFQTPPHLVSEILDFLASQGKQWAQVIEPTCGIGNFIQGICQHPILASSIRQIHGIEINPDYYHLLSQQFRDESKVTLHLADVFQTDFRPLLRPWAGQTLILGNPPWTTSADQGKRESSNLPRKTNFKQVTGLQARTGAANFDLAEAVILKVLHSGLLAGDTLALLCKTSVARSVYEFIVQRTLPVVRFDFRLINTKHWFNAAVTSGLLYCEMGDAFTVETLDIYPDFRANTPKQRLQVTSGVLQDIQQARPSHLFGHSALEWRQGVKHDAASILELTCDGNQTCRNKSGEAVTIESDYIYPLLKGTDLFHGRIQGTPHYLILPQSALSENTRHLQAAAPLLWEYLQMHREVFERRKSSIYRNRPPFALFGVGSYTFAPYKVAISGFHKQPRFQLLGTINARPILLDDTCYFLACQSLDQAAFLTALLNAQASIAYLNTVIFAEAKRPMTKRILQHIDLSKLMASVDRRAVLETAATLAQVWAHETAVTFLEDPSAYLLPTYLQTQETSQQLQLL